MPDENLMTKPFKMGVKADLELGERNICNLPKLPGTKLLRGDILSGFTNKDKHVKSWCYDYYYY